MDPSPGTIAFHTLGCKLNFSETSTLARKFLEAGFERTGEDSPADVHLINTCSVTENADRKCREIIRRARRLSPDALIAVTGCYAQLKPAHISRIPGVDLVLGASEKFDAAEHVTRIVERKKQKGENFEPLVSVSEIRHCNSFIPAFSSGDRTRAFLKVQDGCDYFCSFCTIPLARGKSRSICLYIRHH